MITVQIKGFDSKGEYMTHSQSLALISEVESKFGESACWITREELTVNSELKCNRTECKVFGNVEIDGDFVTDVICITTVSDND